MFDFPIIFYFLWNKTTVLSLPLNPPHPHLPLPPFDCMIQNWTVQYHVQVSCFISSIHLSCISWYDIKWKALLADSPPLYLITPSKSSYYFYYCYNYYRLCVCWRVACAPSFPLTWNAGEKFGHCCRNGNRLNAIDCMEVSFRLELAAVRNQLITPMGEMISPVENTGVRWCLLNSINHIMISH